VVSGELGEQGVIKGGAIKIFTKSFMSTSKVRQWVPNWRTR
jgi:hypothetical protein